MFIYIFLVAFAQAVDVKLVIELQKQIVEYQRKLALTEHMETDIKYYKFKLHAAYTMLGVACFVIICYHIALVRYCKLNPDLNFNKTKEKEELQNKENGFNKDIENKQENIDQLKAEIEMINQEHN